MHLISEIRMDLARPYSAAHTCKATLWLMQLIAAKHCRLMRPFDSLSHIHISNLVCVLAKFWLINQHKVWHGHSCTKYECVRIKNEYPFVH